MEKFVPLWPQCTATTLLFLLLTTSATHAQVQSDGSVGTTVQTSPQSFTVTGGRQIGSTLLHSFDVFSVPQDRSVIFQIPDAIETTISRVTGSLTSRIDGSIQAGGQANFILLNPNGIHFGPGASLQVGGSFLATTAERVDFADGQFFSAREPQVSPLLTVSTPIGLTFGDNPGRIVNQAAFTPEDAAAPTGLEVLPQNTLALVGGEIVFQEGALTAPSGRIELGSVADHGTVTLNTDQTGWRFEYDNGLGRQDIQLSQTSRLIAHDAINLTGVSGNINLYGRNIEISQESDVAAINFGDLRGGSITVNASGAVLLSDMSNIVTATGSAGDAGDIIIEAKTLEITGNSFLLTSPQIFETSSAGLMIGEEPGNIVVRALEQIEVNDQSNISTSSIFVPIVTGNISLFTKRLLVQNGSAITANSLAGGVGGIIEILATESVIVLGTPPLADNVQGPTTRIQAISGGSATGSGGSVRITTGLLLVTNGVIAVDSLPMGQGSAGNLNIEARLIQLEQGELSADTQAAQGDINLSVAESITLLRGSQISTNAEGAAGGGNITINTMILAALNNSAITANAQLGSGGRIMINAQGISRSSDSSFMATSGLGPEAEGVVELNTSGLDPNRVSPELSVNLLSGEAIGRRCLHAHRSRENRFVVVGQGGLPATPTTPLLSQAPLNQLASPVLPSPTVQSSVKTQAVRQATAVPRLEEAQGWVMKDGQLHLVVDPPQTAVAHAVATLRC